MEDIRSVARSNGSTRQGDGKPQQLEARSQTVTGAR